MYEMHRILHSVGERVYYVLLLVLVVSLRKHKYLILFWTKSIASVFLRKVHESVDVIMKNWLHGLSSCQKILAVNRKNGCLSCFICAQWNQSFCLKPMNLLFTLYIADHMDEYLAMIQNVVVSVVSIIVWVVWCVYCAIKFSIFNLGTGCWCCRM